MASESGSIPQKSYEFLTPNVGHSSPPSKASESTLGSRMQKVLDKTIDNFYSLSVKLPTSGKAAPFPHSVSKGPVLTFISSDKATQEPEDEHADHQIGTVKGQSHSDSSESNEHQIGTIKDPSRSNSSDKAIQEPEDEHADHQIGTVKGQSHSDSSESNEHQIGTIKDPSRSNSSASNEHQIGTMKVPKPTPDYSIELYDSDSEGELPGDLDLDDFDNEPVKNQEDIEMTDLSGSHVLDDEVEPSQTQRPQSERINFIASTITPRGQALTDLTKTATVQELKFGKQMRCMAEILNMVKQDERNPASNFQSDLKAFNQRQLAKDPNFKPINNADLAILSASKGNFEKASQSSRELCEVLNLAETPQTKALALEQMSSSYTFTMMSANRPSTSERNGLIMEFLSERPNVQQYISHNTLPPLDTMLNAPKTHLEQLQNTFTDLNKHVDQDSAKKVQKHLKDIASTLKAMESKKEDLKTLVTSRVDIGTTEKSEASEYGMELGEDEDDVAAWTNRPILKHEVDPEEKALLDEIKQNEVLQIHNQINDSVSELKVSVTGKVWNSFMSAIDKMIGKNQSLNKLPAETKPVVAEGFLANLKNLSKEKGFFGLLSMRISHGIIPSRRERFEQSVNDQIDFVINNMSLSADDWQILDKTTQNRDKILMRSRPRSEAGG